MNSLLIRATTKRLKQRQALYILQPRGHPCRFFSPQEFVPLSYDDGIACVPGAQWFVEILQRIPDLSIDKKLCQCDWGVAIVAERDNKHFWIGLNFWLEGEWLVHFHHGSFAWLQRLSTSGKEALNKLIIDADAVLKADPAITTITWYEQSDLTKPNAKGFNSPA